MAASVAVYKIVAVLFVVLLAGQVRECRGQWAQTNGWGGAGVGKRTYQQPGNFQLWGNMDKTEYKQPGIPERCKVDPYIALLISRLAKLEAERMRICGGIYADDDSK